MTDRAEIEISNVILNGIIVFVSAVFASPFGLIAAWYAFGA